jgi:hypothetical protein
MSRATLRTKRSTPKLSEIARRVVAPAGVVSTGWRPVEQKCLELGIRFRPWQPDVGRLILAKRADGKYAATIGGTGLSIPRQVGKTFLVGAIVFALCLLRPNLTVIWTAHRLRTAEETFGKMQAMARRKRIAPHILKLVLGSGEEEVRFRNGSRILFGARERGFGRGFDEVDVLIFDEAQILTESALDDMVPATNQSRQETSALLLFMGTPPKPTDPGEVFKRMRSEALSGEDDNTGWVEFGADTSYKPTPAPEPLTDADWRQVVKANPSFPQDTPREAILRMRKQLGPEAFLREGMGIWDEDAAAGGIFGASWGSCLEDPLPAAALEWVSVAATVDLRFAGIVGGGLVDGRKVIKPLAHGAGLAWVADEFARWPDLPVVVDAKGPAAVLLPALRVVCGKRLHEATSPEVFDACAGILTDVRNGVLAHGGDRALDDAVAAAVQRDVGDRWAWGRRKSGADICLIEAATLAAWALDGVKPKEFPPPDIF